MNKNRLETNDEKIATHARENASAELAKLKRAGANVSDEIVGYVKKQPLAAIGIAVAAGFVLGGFFASKLARMALISAVGYAAQKLVEASFGEGGVRKIIVAELSKLGGSGTRGEAR
jgi:hypothetical protein